MTAIQSALTGMHQAESQIDATASRIANSPFPNVPGAQNPPQDQLDLSTDMVNLLQSRSNFAADVKVAHVADDIQKSTISILG
jgi:flagellar hook protein FlgE